MTKEGYYQPIKLFFYDLVHPSNFVFQSGQDTESPQRSSLPPDSNHLALQALESRLQVNDLFKIYA